MSRWFHHYAGMMRDPKFVSIAVRTKQPLERVLFVWSCCLESAAEINEGGRFEIDPAEIAYLLRCGDDEIAAILEYSEGFGMTTGSAVVGWTAVRDRDFGPEWADLRMTVFARDGFRCTYCGQTGVPLECDHIVPFSRGGSDDLSNLATACRSCNRSKRARTPDEWRAVQ